MTDSPQDAEEPEARLAMLSSFLDQDPGNAALLADTAEAALEAGEVERAAALFERAAGVRPPGPRERGLAGLAHMRRGRFDDAAAAFSALLAEGADDPAVRFNLAWSRMMTKDQEGALAALDPDTGDALPQAAALEVQLLHATGRLDEAFERGRRHLESHPDARGLTAAMSVLAIDVGDEGLAAECARKVPDHPDALATLGTLALGGDDATGAHAFFDEAISRNPDVPRAWVGRGLAHLLSGRPERAPADIDRGAELFGDHLGSWIAAGWAHFIAGDASASRIRFERALELDPTFGETHGSLAVLDALAGDPASARERAAVALRLDRASFSAALASALLTTAAGDADATRAILDRALNASIDGSDKTIARSLTRMGMSVP